MPLRPWSQLAQLLQGRRWIARRKLQHHAARFFLERYPELLVARYKFKEQPASPTALIEEIGRRRGCLRAGGVVETYKAASILVHDFRTGALGRISLEAPREAYAG